jgi:hypothetical protein
LRDFSQLSGSIQNQIENNQGKIAIAQKEIGGFDCLKRLRATNPKQVTQSRVTKSSEGGGIEGISPVYQGEKIASALRVLQKSIKQQRTSSAHVGAA